MLELRPTCENCKSTLPPDSEQAMISSYECTFCRSCALQLLDNVCPNCGGGFSPRPIRPRHDHKGGNHLGADPASTTVKHRPVDLEAHRRLAARLASTPPALR